MVTAALVLLAGALLLAGHLRDDAYLVAVALGLSLAAVVVETVQVLRARRAVPAPAEPDPPPVELVESTPSPSLVEPVETTPAETTPAETTPAETTPAEAAADPDPEPAPVRLPGRTTYHRPDCPTVRGKTVVPFETARPSPPQEPPVEAAAEPDEVLKPCGRCRPTPLDRAGEASDGSR